MTRRPTPTHRTALIALVAAATLVLGACGSSGGDSSADPTTTAPAGSSTTAKGTDEAAPLSVLVSNDDGYGAPGIDALVEALRKVPGVTVQVVAPTANQSGTGGKTTNGPVTHVERKTASGFDAVAVDGFPADSVNVAFDDLKADPDVVITGINLGQNIGPVIDLSGTVGAARAAAAHGVPALAVSQGFGKTVDYPAAVPLVLDWLTEHRGALAAGKAPVQVTNLNVPSCDTGKVRGLLEVKPEPGAPTAEALSPQDCTSTTPEEELTGDVDAFLAGFATESVVATTTSGE